MKALILNGERKNEDALVLVEQTLVGMLRDKGWQVERILLRDVKVARCLGCFGCWVKTPGVCVVDDFGRNLAMMAAPSDLMVFLTAVTFGGYSSELKKAVDRFACPLLLPFFTKISGKIRHKPRYQNRASLIGIGVLPGPDRQSEEMFKSLIERNAANFHSPASKSAVIYLTQDAVSIKEKISGLLQEVSA